MYPDIPHNIGGTVGVGVTVGVTVGVGVGVGIGVIVGIGGAVVEDKYIHSLTGAKYPLYCP